MRGQLYRLAAVSIALVAPAAVVAALAPAASAAMPSSRVVLAAPLQPSVPADPPIFGVNPGKVPWVLHAGHVVLGQDGRLELNVAGFIDPVTGTNPVPRLSASVYCAGTLAGTTPTAAFPADGNARIHAMVSLPASCPDPVVLVNPGANTKAYIASTPVG